RSVLLNSNTLADNASLKRGIDTDALACSQLDLLSKVLLETRGINRDCIESGPQVGGGVDSGFARCDAEDPISCQFCDLNGSLRDRRANLVPHLASQFGVTGLSIRCE